MTTHNYSCRAIARWYYYQSALWRIRTWPLIETHTLFFYDAFIFWFGVLKGKRLMGTFDSRISTVNTRFNEKKFTPGILISHVICFSLAFITAGWTTAMAIKFITQATNTCWVLNLEPLNYVPGQCPNYWPLLPYYFWLLLI